MNSKEENSQDFCPNYVQEFGHSTVCGWGGGYWGLADQYIDTRFTSVRIYLRLPARLEKIPRIVEGLHETNTQLPQIPFTRTFALSDEGSKESEAVNHLSFSLSLTPEYELFCIDAALYKP